MRNFNETSLLKQAKALQAQAQSAFGQACAWRTLSLASAALPGTVQTLCEQGQRLALDFVAKGKKDTDAIQQVLSDLRALPELDDDRVAACAYVVGHLLSGQPEEVVWAARRAYEATDQLAQQSISFTQYTPAIEMQLLGHTQVQAELERQAIDLEQLKREPGQSLAVILRAKENAGRGHV